MTWSHENNFAMPAEANKTTTRKESNTVVAVTLHDGVGNQLFQFSFASLLSQALGAHQLFLDPMQLVASGSARLQKGQVKRSAGSERMLRTMFPAGFGEENSGSRAV